MDPEQCLSEILALLLTKFEEDRDDIVERLRALADWLEKDGFMPSVVRAIEDREPK